MNEAKLGFLFSSFSHKTEKAKWSDDDVITEVRFGLTQTPSQLESWRQLFSSIANVPVIKELLRPACDNAETESLSSDEVLKAICPDPLEVMFLDVYNQYWHSSYLSTTQISITALKTLAKYEDNLGYYNSFYKTDNGKLLKDNAPKNETEFFYRLVLVCFTVLSCNYDYTGGTGRFDQLIYLLRTTAQMLETRKSLRKLCGLTDEEKDLVHQGANILRGVAGELVRFQAAVDRYFSYQELDSHFDNEYHEFKYRYHNKQYVFVVSDLEDFSSEVYLALTLGCILIARSDVYPWITIKGVQSYLLKKYVTKVKNLVNDEDTEDVEENVFVR